VDIKGVEHNTSERVLSIVLVGWGVERSAFLLEDSDRFLGGCMGVNKRAEVTPQL